MSRMYFATVVAVFVTTSLATNLLVVGTRGPVLPGPRGGLRGRTRRLRRRLKRAVDSWVAAVLAHRERQAAAYVVHHMSYRELKDIGLYPGSLGRVARPDAKRVKSPVPPLTDRRSG